MFGISKKKNNEGKEKEISRTGMLGEITKLLTSGSDLDLLKMATNPIRDFVSWLSARDHGLITADQYPMDIIIHKTDADGKPVRTIISGKCDNQMNIKPHSQIELEAALISFLKDGADG